MKADNQSKVFNLITQIGKNKYPISSYENRMLIEVVKDNCGAAGLAHHGVLGISRWRLFLQMRFTIAFYQVNLNQCIRYFIYEG